MHAISSYRGNRPTHKQTHTQDRLQYTAPQLARSVIKIARQSFCVYRDLQSSAQPPVHRISRRETKQSYYTAWIDTAE